MSKSPARRQEETRLPLSKLLLFSAVTVIGFFGLVELVLALRGVQPTLVAADPYVGFSSELELFMPSRDGRLRTAPNKLALFNEQSFTRKKRAGSFRLFTVGGSVTYGRPFDDGTSFTGWLRSYLATAAPDRDWEVSNAGGISYASYRVAKLMEELIAYEPDLFIVLTGHNEFLERRTYGDIIAEPRAVTRGKLLLARSRLVALGRRLVDRSKARARQAYELEGEVAELLESSAGLNYYFRDDEFERQVLGHHRFNLQRMIDLAHSVGAAVILVSLPVNEKDFAPFKSQYRDGLEESERSRVSKLLEAAANGLAAGDAEGARDLAAQAVAIDPLYAEAHYQLGRALQSLGLDSEAAASSNSRVASAKSPCFWHHCASSTCPRASSGAKAALFR